MTFFISDINDLSIIKLFCWFVRRSRRSTTHCQSPRSGGTCTSPRAWLKRNWLLCTLSSSTSRDSIQTQFELKNTLVLYYLTCKSSKISHFDGLNMNAYLLASPHRMWRTCTGCTRRIFSSSATPSASGGRRSPSKKSKTWSTCSSDIHDCQFCTIMMMMMMTKCLA